MPTSTTGSISAPGMGAFAITPADSDLSTPARALWVGVAGDLRVTALNGGDVVLKAAIGLIPISVKRVWSTNTTASSIVGLT